MKKLLLSVPFLILLTSSNVVVADHIGVYGDLQGENCALTPGFNNTTFVVHKFSNGATASRFKVTVPASSTIFNFAPAANYIPLGVVQTDMVVIYQDCLEGCFVIGTITAIWPATGVVSVDPPDGFANVHLATCEQVEEVATEGHATLGAGGCFEYACVLPTEPATWSKVKSLYR